MFEITENLFIKEENLFDSSVFIIDNFYKNPEKIIEYINKNDSPLWKKGESENLNGKAYIDKRMVSNIESLEPVYKFFSEICNHIPLHNPDTFITNQFRMIDERYNKYENCYWYPHYDDGWTAIIYLNKETCSGTNLYNPNVPIGFFCADPEHLDPWKEKQYFNCVKTFTSKYNRAIFFDAKKFPHGMAITDDRFFREERINQVLFYA